MFQLLVESADSVEATVLESDIDEDVADDMEDCWRNEGYWWGC